MGLYFLLTCEVTGDKVKVNKAYNRFFRYTFVTVSHSTFNTLPISFIFGMYVPCMDLYLLMRLEVTGVKVKVTEANKRLFYVVINT